MTTVAPRPRGAAPAGQEAVVRQELAEQTAARERAEATLRETELRAERTFATLPVGQAELDPDGRLVRVNHALAELLGYDDPAELVGRPPGSLLADPSCAADQADDLARLRRGELTSYSRERVYSRRDGTPVPVIVTVGVMTVVEGVVTSLISTVVDNTARQAALSSLEHAHRMLESSQAAERDRATFLSTVLDTVGVGIVACDADGHLTIFNEATRVMHGLGPDPLIEPEHLAERFDLYDADGTTLLTPDQVPLVRALREGRVDRAEITLAPKGLPARLVRCDGQAMHDADGRLLGAVVAMQDITQARHVEHKIAAASAELRRANEALVRSEQQFRAAFEHGPMPMCRLDAAGVVRQANPALRRLLSRTSAQVLDRAFVAMVADSDREAVTVALAAASASHLEVDMVEARVARLDGAEVWCEIAFSGGQDGDGAPFVLVQLADVHDRRVREEALELAARVDDLTGLPNRSALAAALDRRRALGVRSVLLFMDLDGFKAVNDSAGHAVGDEVLVEVGRRLVDAVRPEDLVVRLGGDEFVVLCGAHEGSSESLAQSVVRRVTAALEDPVATSVGFVRVGTSIGVAQGRPGEAPSELLDRADRAMYTAKARARPPVHGARPRPAPAAAQRSRGPGQSRLAELVRSAVEEERLDLVYQPLVDLATGFAAGAEALVRMRDREGVSVMPDAFIPMAEFTGAVNEIGEWVMRTALVQTAAWKRLLPVGADFGIGVNVSPRELEAPGFLDRLDDVLVSSGIDRAAVVLELTERMVLPDTTDMRAVLEGVRERGVHLACDDFGTGHASLRYLADFPIDIVKIDRSFTSRLQHDGLALGVVRLTQATGLVVIAEGIEVVGEQDALVAEGCPLGQGYLYARPQAAADLPALFQRSLLP